ncbi:hypothetical protein R3W88_022525 [Solanum pinnatisectum]|uniref:Leucine-rich repeat-containing N-terminal plant-type domain-containing protein n=1 Tax=Solanum pinnatisectum TaxID=50273 RepID=A0AAV9LYS4_9SOLN|nr:hypothetical protein R3W88_022525 [Solanum pinnatisectum]
MRNIKFLLLVFFLIVIVANGCWEEERSALLELQANIMSSNGELLVDWAGYNANGFTDYCCFWKRVKCSLATGRVIKLNLETNFGTGDGWRFNVSLFLPFKSLQLLSLSSRNIIGWTKNEDLLSSLCWISSLEVLKLGAHVDTSFNKCGGLTNLRKLWFEGYEINDINILSIFPSLKHLNLAANEINGNIEMNDIIDLSNLEYLELLHNNIESFATTKGNKRMSSLRNLLLGSSYSNSSRVIESLKSFSTLKPLSYEYSDLTSPTIIYVKLKSIFFRNNLRGNISSHSIWRRFASLEYLDIVDNQFDVSLSFSQFSNNTKLIYLDVGYNTIIRIRIPKLDPKFPVRTIQVAIICHLHLTIDVSNNKLNGHIPDKMNSAFPKLTYLNMSQNNLEGPIPTKISGIHLVYLYLSHNVLSGGVPSDAQLNHLKGSIPVEICNLKLIQVLAISENKLLGFIPYCVNSLPLEHIHLEKNQLGGELGHVLFNFSSLITLDLGYNNFTGNIPHTIGSLNTLNYLLLSHNQLEGEIPTQICMLNKLSIVDISFNKLYGPLLPCLSYLTQAKKDAKISKTNYATTSWHSWLTFLHWIRSKRHYHDSHGILSDIFLMDVETQVQFSTKRNSYTYKGSILKYMSGIDLSSNRLTGEIPIELGNMSNIAALNLSHNHLIGRIPNTFFNLQKIESLDLSFNRLNGSIPFGLLELNFLAVFSVAYNNLSAAARNPFLCGYPLDNKCGMSPKLSNTSKINGDEESSELEDIQEFYIGFVVSYGAILLGLAAALCFNRHWRTAWFRMIEALMFYCYYFVLDNIVTPIKNVGQLGSCFKILMYVYHHY